ncbi:carboxylesterase family domain-containing protein [Ditylenchus destructor]|nr:carboxylesterase family domain-containing protein [Ditylenchus destructor]
MALKIFTVFAIFSLFIKIVDPQQLPPIFEPTRPIDLWNPFGTTTTRRPGMDQRKDEIIVRLSIGDIVGRKVIIPNLPWTANHDPLEVIPDTRSHLEPDPVPKYNDVTVFTFLGVPYAEPPISQRRLKPPQQLIQLPGESPFIAFEHAPSCAQDIETRPTLFINEPYPYRVSEDCLYLNVFTPDASKSSGNVYPVMVFFHGGNFQTGTANDWPGHVLASRGIVVVTVNYRLGPLGFLSLGDKDTGNYGIQDQRMALTWVQQHIGSVGGDPQAVTIVGHDAGAVSAGIHMLSPYSRNLFRGVVAMSGAEVSYHSVIGKPALAFNNTMKLGRYLGCVQPVAQHVWDCILTRSTNDIIQAVSPSTVPAIPIEYNRYLFMPTVDGRELTSHPLFILNNAPSGATSVHSPVPYLTGLNQEDGVEAILEDRTLGEFTDFMQLNQAYMHSFIVEYAFRHNYTMNKEAIIEAVESFYTFWPDAADVWKIREKFIELITDAYYTAPISQSAHLHSLAGSRTFMYVNNFNFSHHKQNAQSDQGKKLPIFPDWVGSCHECDLYLLFGFPFMPKELLPKPLSNVPWMDIDRNASQLFSMFIRQFIKYGDPNLPNEIAWKNHQPREHWYLDFNYTFWQSLSLSSSDMIKRDYRFHEVAFWNYYIPSLVNYMTTTFPPSEVSVRRSLMAFQFMGGICVLIIMILLVISLSMGYSICTNSTPREDFDHRHLVNSQQDNYPPGGHINMQRISSL